jgi:glycine cleavage system T protein (aminomethyltransferase)
MRTALYDRHIALGAKIVPFAGWEMPLHYSQGILHEHHAVRNSVGLFDVSHMGRIDISGPGAEKFVDFLSTNRIAGKADLTATYTVFANAQGGSVDDLLVYKIDANQFFVVANARNRQKDLDHIQREAAAYDVTVRDHFADMAILALQGPMAASLIAPLLHEVTKIAAHHLLPLTFEGKPLIASATGYTGAGGYEFFGPADTLVKLWDQLLREGAEPVGLGARDTLRLEKGYALYGHELSDSIAPTESIAAWTVKGDNREFLGKKALEQLKSKRHAYGIVLQEKGIAREGCAVYKAGNPIGIVTSGSFSPSLNKAIALILVQETLSLGDSLTIQIRNKPVRAERVALPFL